MSAREGGREKHEEVPTMSGGRGKLRGKEEKLEGGLSQGGTKNRLLKKSFYKGKARRGGGPSLRRTGTPGEKENLL